MNRALRKSFTDVEFSKVTNDAVEPMVPSIENSRGVSASHLAQNRRGTDSASQLIPAFAIGDRVTWKGCDADIPAGVIGHVVRVFADGDVEAEFPSQIGGSQRLFTFKGSRLQPVPRTIERHGSTMKPADMARIANAYKAQPEL